MNCKAMNEDICPCTESCPHHGKCCECIRNHIGDRTYPETACMRTGRLNG